MVASNTTLLADVLLIAMLIVLTAGSLLSGIISKIDIEVIAQQKGRTVVPIIIEYRDSTKHFDIKTCP
jgi:formate hydrogenlyase subunit 4